MVMRDGRGGTPGAGGDQGGPCGGEGERAERRGQRPGSRGMAGGTTPVVVPLTDFMRLRALEQLASAQELEDVEDAAALEDWRRREAAGETSYMPADEVRRRLGLTR
jgi:hypothetical protein